MLHTTTMNIAHRGSSAEAPENTLAAFRLALERQCDAIELDIHLSADGRVIVCHDPTLDRTTNGTGAIAELTADEIRRFDAGSWFGPQYAGERVPLLDEVLDLVPPSIGINVEIKSHDNPRTVAAVVDLLVRRERLDSVFFSSFAHECMAELKRYAPNAKIGLLYMESTFDYEAFFERAGVEGYALHPYFEFVDADYVAAAGKRGLRVFPWTVDDPARMGQLVRDGASGIITNVPAALRSLL